MDRCLPARRLRAASETSIEKARNRSVPGKSLETAHFVLEGADVHRRAGPTAFVRRPTIAVAERP